MIKIGKKESELNILAKEFYKKVLLNLNFNQKLSLKLVGSTRNEYILYKNLDDNKKIIIIGCPKELENIISLIDPLYEAVVTERINNHVPPPPLTSKQIRKVRIQVKKEILEIFNYSNFTTFNEGKWAYQHSKSLDLIVCPYCNCQYTFTIKTSRGKTRPQFDHFFNKSKYPYLALSFFNLIPSCYVCNANLKSDKVFSLDTHIHPLIEGVEDTVIFKTNVKTVDYLTGNSGFEIQLANVDKAIKSKVKRAKKNAKVFHIEEQYKFHKDYAGEVISKAYLYTESKLEELLKEFEIEPGRKLFSSREEIIEVLFGSHIKEEKLHKRVLTKLTKDLVSEMGILL